ncbi:hypothetical protein C8Q80DRAFT_825179 [Daedaleopsis nitida]|nr:hypothetical protein C8Q80DRAFT_825179 [Daedaleopsis nitida]
MSVLAIWLWSQTLTSTSTARPDGRSGRSRGAGCWGGSIGLGTGGPDRRPVSLVSQRRSITGGTGRLRPRA